MARKRIGGKRTTQSSVHKGGDTLITPKDRSGSAVPLAKRKAKARAKRKAAK